MNDKRPPCSGFMTYTELLRQASNSNRAALECLAKVIKNEIIPSLKRRFPKIRIEDIEDIAWEALVEFLAKIEIDNSKEYNIGLLWRIVKLRMIDFIRKNKSFYSDTDIDDLQNISESDADEGNQVDFNFSHIDESYLMEFIKELKKLLTEEENILFDLHILGTKTIQEVQDLMGWSKGTISRMKDSIYQKAKDLIENKRKGLI